MRLDDVTVFVLCGGRGSRLGRRTRHLPKTLVPVKGRPILDHILRQFAEQGFGHYVLGTGYLSEQVAAHVARHWRQLDITIANAGTAASMLARIHRARALCRRTLVVAYGDTFVDIDYRKLLRSHRASGARATIVTGKIQNPFGVVSLTEAGRVRSFVEKPVLDYYIGCFVCGRSLIERLPAALTELRDGAGIVRLFQRLARQRALGSHCHRGLQVTFNTSRELQDAQRVLRTYHTLQEGT